MLKSFLDIISRPSRKQDGQILVLAVGMFIVVILVAAMVLDGGFFMRARRDSQNAADAAALAGAQHLPDDPGTAIAAALDWTSLNGWTNGVDGTTITVNTPYQGAPNKIEVIVEGPAGGVHFFPPLMDVRSRAVAEVVVTGSSGSGEPGPGTIDPNAPPMVPVPAAGCGGDTADVDGRVMSDEGYEKIGNLISITTFTVFGEAFFACGSEFLYFALRLNGPSTGGAVANENVYECRVVSECIPPDNPAYHSFYNTGWSASGKGNHSFRDLLKSDRANFQISCGGTVIHAFEQDYLRVDGAGWASDTSSEGAVIAAGPADSSSSMVYNLEHPVETGWGDDPGEHPLSQSPPFDPSYPTYDSQYDGWVWEVIYEFSLPRADYDACGGTVYFGLPSFGGEAGPVGGIHSSPAKVAGGSSIFVEQEILIRLVE